MGWENAGTSPTVRDGRLGSDPRDKTERHPPEAGPGPAIYPVPPQQLAGDSAVEEHRLAAAQGSHHGCHLGRRKTERNAAELLAQRIEPSERDDHMSVGRGAEGEPRVAMLEADAESLPPQRIGDGACNQQHRIALECFAEPARGSHLFDAV